MFYDITVVQASKMLGNLKSILEKAAVFAEDKKIDPEVLLTSRLAPDQFPLVRQVQVCCDTAKLGAARLAGKADSAPKHEDSETTLEELYLRIAAVQDYLATFTEADFTDTASRVINLPWRNDKQMLGSAFAINFVIPNLYFHVTTAYAILRHNGVDVGKLDYLGAIPYIE
ncbi:Uncharacterised protein [Zhongshania aliphaticivorans]|uniref:DUF1993 domain-containing protein n=1 Tax=Zhongshania aliphaticivorans TaxID=1470434 RepID=A0A5S9MPJ5_9GAMM|nr:DUF1993 domain-containing protein [Zhongshania aliphaticivorans]CAA0078910.1 Uncharacterised protein [Zhongshania aliphaticivorans]CAA0086459.1 Uncharacterised protein [Zhongshania aliphaticivorans]